MCITILKTMAVKIKTAMIDKKKLEKEIDVLGSEIAKAYILTFALQELIEQSHINFNVYIKYHEFFYQTYSSYHNELTHHISHLQDTSRDSLSIIKLLNRSKDYNDQLSVEEGNILSQLIDHEIGKKIKVIRDKLGRAHLDYKIALNPDKEQKIYEQNKVTLMEIIQYLELLTKALTIISRRLDIPIADFLKPIPSLRGDIRRLFEDLAFDEKKRSSQSLANKISRDEITV